MPFKMAEVWEALSDSEWWKGFKNIIKMGICLK